MIIQHIDSLEPPNSKMIFRGLSDARTLHDSLYYSQTRLIYLSSQRLWGKHYKYSALITKSSTRNLCLHTVYVIGQRSALPDDVVMSIHLVDVDIFRCMGENFDLVVLDEKSGDPHSR